MSDRSHISWTSATWNPVTGCDRVSDGCDNCYALALAGRLKAMGSPRYQHDGDPRRSGPGFGLTIHDDKLFDPMRWRAPRRVFVNSMSDLFHRDVPNEFIAHIFAVMAAAPRHVFQVLTKRPPRMASLLRKPRFRKIMRAHLDGLKADWNIDSEPVTWPLPNVWLGTSIENQRWADVRVPKLLDTPAAVRFLSCEPLLGPISLSAYFAPGDPGQIAWVIVGGESGRGHRAMDAEWARSLRDQCLRADVAFFYKQGAGARPEMDRTLDGRRWEQMPILVGA